MEYSGCHLFNYFDVDEDGIIELFEMKSRFDELAGDGECNYIAA
jgi:hypothetical protein